MKRDTKLKPICVRVEVSPDYISDNYRFLLKVTIGGLENGPTDKIVHGETILISKEGFQEVAEYVFDKAVERFKQEMWS